MAGWAASVCGGHVGRARRLAGDEPVRARRDAVLRIPLALQRPADVFTCADDLVKAAEEDAATANDARDEAERAALETAMGDGGTGKGTAAATRGSAGRDQGPGETPEVPGHPHPARLAGPGAGRPRRRSTATCW